MNRTAALALTFMIPAGLFAAGLPKFIINDYAPAETPLLFQELNIRAGSTVAEIGAGHGFMAIATAEAVGPSGKVFATEINAKRLTELRERIEKKQLRNVTVVEGTASAANLPESCCDAIYLRSVYHHVAAPAEMDPTILKALRPGGLLAIDDFPPSRALKLISRVKGRKTHGITREDVKQELTAAGFEFVKQVEYWPGDHTYGLIFRKPAK